MMECQGWLPAEAGSFIAIQPESDADVDANAPDRFINLTLNAAGDVTLRWDARNGSANTASGTGSASGQLLHVALQKGPSSDTLRLFLDGALRITETPAPISMR